MRALFTGILSLTMLALILACAPAEQPVTEVAVDRSQQPPAPGNTSSNQMAGAQQPPAEAARGASQPANAGTVTEQTPNMDGRSQPTQVFLRPNTETLSATAESAKPTQTATIPPEPTPFQATIETDREILKELYHATNGDSWTRNDNWLSDQPMAEWYGVTTGTVFGGADRVVELDLADNGLSGALPVDFWFLDQLTLLYLEDNALIGDIPDLTELERDASNLVSLKEVDLGGNQLTGCVPIFLYELVPQDYRDFGDLQSCPNPDRIALTSLYNAAGGPEWTNRTNWNTDSPLNEWEGIGTGPSGRVTHMNLRNNNLNGNIPQEIANLEYLKTLTLGNALGDFLPAHLASRETGQDFGDLLKDVEGANKLIGPFPVVLLSLPNLRYLTLEGVGLTGPIPADISNLPELESINLSFNTLEGAIPPEIGQLPNLINLALTNNHLSGPIPPDLADLENLQSLSLRSNMLEGPIPAEIGGLKSLHQLDLARNQITGEIPSELGNLAALSEGNHNLYSLISLADNLLTGAIPRSFQKLKTLQDLDLSNNQLTGEIPRQMAEMTDGQQGLKTLDLSDNQLSGAIPHQIEKLAFLEELSLANNQLTGNIPEELQELRSLWLLHLGGNQFTGCIPRGLEMSLQDIDRMELPTC